MTESFYIENPITYIGHLLFIIGSFNLQQILTDSL